MKNSDLNKIFPHIGRSSKRTDEALFYDELRISPAVTIISGGQSGIDSIGLETASFLGLPAFAILPEAGRREDGSFSDYLDRAAINVRTYELSSESYRFRTYANVFYSDFTLIYDFVNSEGTAATVDACLFLDRPYIVISSLDQESFTAAYTALLQHRPHVVNIAGNSLSKINEEIAGQVKEHLSSVLKAYCFLRKNSTFHSEPYSSSSEKPIIAIPNFSVSKRLFADFFEKAFCIPIHFSKKLVYDLAPCRLVLARPREIIPLVDSGVNAGFVGKDLCLENNHADILLDTGLIPNSMVVCAKSHADTSLPVCSQYPAAANKYMPDSRIAAITGSAESYLSLGIYGVAVDSYQTGITLKDNELVVKSKLFETSLVLIGNPKLKETLFYKRFIWYMTTYPKQQET